LTILFILGIRGRVTVGVGGLAPEAINVEKAACRHPQPEGRPLPVETRSVWQEAAELGVIYIKVRS
jgi:hypothetical protein